MRDVRIGIELREKFIERRGAEGEEERLIAIVAAAPIACAKGPRQRELRDFFAVAEDAELRFSGEHFFPSDQAGLTAAKGDAIVVDDALARELRTRLLRLLRCGHDHSGVVVCSRRPEAWGSPLARNASTRTEGLRTED